MNIIFTFLTMLAVALGVFLILREVFLWYWKVNDILSELQKANIFLKAIASGNKLSEENESGHVS